MNLPFVRFVKQVSNGVSASKHGYIDMMERNAKRLESSPWHEAECDPSRVSLTGSQLSRTDGKVDSETGEWIKVPTYTAYIDDRYDAFNMAGDAVPRMGTMCGYAGCVAYRFTLPKDPNDQSFSSIISNYTIAVQRDRYLRAGVRLSVMPSYVDDSSSSGGRDLDTPDLFSWDQVRNGFAEAFMTPSEAVVRDQDDSGSSSSGGSSEVNGVSSWGFLNQKDVPYLLETMAGKGEWTVENIAQDYVEFREALRRSKYLWVFMTLEDLAGYWDMYSAEEKRFYYIEGAAVIMPSQCDFGFENSGTQPPDPGPGGSFEYEVLKGRLGPTRFTDSTLVPAFHSTRLLNGDPMKAIAIQYDMEELIATLRNTGATINRIQVIPKFVGFQKTEYGVSMEDDISMLAICGKGFGDNNTFRDFDGLILYDIKRNAYMQQAPDSDDSEVQEEWIVREHTDGWGGVESVAFSYVWSGADMTAAIMCVGRESNGWWNSWAGGDGYMYRLDGRTSAYVASINGFLYDQNTHRVYKKRSEHNIDEFLIEYLGLNKSTAFPVRCIKTMVSDYYSLSSEIIGLNSRSIPVGNDLPFGMYNGVLKSDVIDDVLPWCNDIILLSRNREPIVIGDDESGSGTLVNTVVNPGHDNHLVQYLKDIDDYSSVSNDLMLKSVREGKYSKTAIDYDNSKIVFTYANQDASMISWDGSVEKLQGTLGYSDIGIQAGSGIAFGLRGDVVYKSLPAPTGTNYDRTYSAAGLTAAAGKFYSGGAEQIKTISGTMSLAFNLNGKTKFKFDTGDSTDQEVDCWQIAASGMVIPFRVPASFSPRYIRFDWSDSTNSALLPTGLQDRKGKAHVYLMRGQFIDSLPDVASNPGAWLGNAISDADYLGSFDMHADLAKTATLDIPSDLSGTVATLVLLPEWPYIDKYDPAKETYSSDSVIGFGRINYSYLDDGMYVSENIQWSGIVPAITLL